MNIVALGRRFVSRLKATENLKRERLNLILSILKSTTTKREAKRYLKRYGNLFDFSSGAHSGTTGSRADAGSQRNVFVKRFLAGRDPFTNIYGEDGGAIPKAQLRTALFKVKVEELSSTHAAGLAETLKRLVALGVSPILVLDIGISDALQFKAQMERLVVECRRFMDQLQEDSDSPTLKPTLLRCPFTQRDHRDVVDDLKQIVIPLYQGIMPILIPVRYEPSTTQQVFTSADEAFVALASELLAHEKILSIEKVAIIDQIGGIPSIERKNTSHVLINLSQEFLDILSELHIGFLSPSLRDKHIRNLETIKAALHCITKNTTSTDPTGIITTPEVMAINDDQMNPVVYNVLTDRPIMSSSLPVTLNRPLVSTSVVKAGYNVTVLRKEDCAHSFNLETLDRLKLVDSRRLVELLNDSFGKTLQTDEYFERLKHCLATIIIVGDYDGAAIVTHEEAPGGAVVPYLDKFAISSKNQGLPGLADIIFKLVISNHRDELLWRSQKNNPVNKWYFERCVGSLCDAQWRVFFTGEKFQVTNRERVHFSRGLSSYLDIVENIPSSFSSKL